MFTEEVSFHPISSILTYQQRHFSWLTGVSLCHSSGLRSASAGRLVGDGLITSNYPKTYDTLYQIIKIYQDHQDQNMNILFFIFIYFVLEKVQNKLFSIYTLVLKRMVSSAHCRRLGAWTASHQLFLPERRSSAQWRRG